MKKVWAGILIATMLMGTVLLTGCFDDSQVQRAETTQAGNGAQDTTIEEEMTIEVETTEQAEKTTEAETTQEAVNSNSRTNPAGLNETFTVYKDDWWSGRVEFEIEMVDIVSGEDAWDIVQEANMFNDEPGEGKEYVLVKFRFKIIETEEDEPYSLWLDTSFDVISETGVQYTDFVSVAGLEPSLDNDLYAGAEHAGWTAFMVDEEDRAVVAVDRRTNAEVWFDLRAGN